MATNPSSRVRMAGTTCIHYLGPQRELDAIESFTELGCLLPAHHIRIVFVGPDVPHALDGASLLRPSPRVPLCGNVACSCAATAREPVSDGTSRSRTPAASSVDEAGIGDRDAFPGWAGSQGSLRMDFHRGLYHDWIGGLAEEGAEQRAPDLVFAANAGLEAYAGWRPSLERLEAGVPLVVTDYCEEAAARAGVVLGALGLRVRSVGLNPFRQPVRDRRAGNNLPSCSNGFVLVAERAGSRRGGHASWDGCVRSS
ncbi:unnamed protein product [Ostreobium quekettii]|uniref:Mitochondrial splicing suppressor 51-like C-terminal domain-containing protein n=1 Tax=Ostreobium quekettii TaxID=121088 RepID=A0A8S1IV58_9CHLO|nr:unnamed protein product [Ostreobium quekettii]|eukprot:evm.model.scf_11.5 EVM.evm.TU.scf_11.5   scf_11:28558-32105(-)